VTEPVRGLPRATRHPVSLQSASARGRAFLRCRLEGDGGRSGALFGARPGAAGGTHSTGCRARLRAPSSWGSGHRCSRSLLRPQRHEWGSHSPCKNGKVPERQRAAAYRRTDIVPIVELGESSSLRAISTTQEQQQIVRFEHAMGSDGTLCGIPKSDVEVVRHLFMTASRYACPECRSLYTVGD